jgi:PAS domain S-box-containing protein
MKKTHTQDSGNPSNLFADFHKINEHDDIFKQMFKYSVIPTIIHDMDMNIINANDRATEKFGYSQKELLKKSVFDLHTKDQLNHSKEVLNEMQQKEKMSIETSFKRKDGSVFFAEVTPCKFLLGVKPVIHVYIQDISERKRTERELEAFRQQLIIKNKELDYQNEEKEKQITELSKIKNKLELSIMQYKNRELKIIELKKEINELLINAGGEVKYII